jgi:hypothetical protein
MAVAMLALAPAVRSNGVAVAQTCAPVAACGDLNEDGSVNTSDALNLLKKAVGGSPNIKCECSGSGDPTCDADLATCTADLAACEAQPVCGNGVIEDCDAGDNGGATCVTEGFEGGTIGCSFCVFDTKGCYVTRFDASGPTIIDLQTGLEWEKKTGANGTVNYADPHDVDNDYTWCAGSGLTCNDAGAPLDGTIATDFLAKLNGTSDGMCYQNHCDWRLPTLEELQSIALAPADCAAAPCVADAVLLPMRPNYYWSSTSYLFNANIAWLVNFQDGMSSASYKPSKSYVRAVRSGT